VDLVYDKPGSSSVEAAVHGRHCDDSRYHELQVALSIHPDISAKAEDEGGDVKKRGYNCCYQVVGKASPKSREIGPEDGIGPLRPLSEAQ